MTFAEERCQCGEAPRSEHIFLVRCCYFVNFLLLIFLVINLRIFLYKKKLPKKEIKKPPYLNKDIIILQYSPLFNRPILEFSNRIPEVKAFIPNTTIIERLSNSGIKSHIDNATRSNAITICQFLSFISFCIIPFHLTYEFLCCCQTRVAHSNPSLNLIQILICNGTQNSVR